MNARKNAPAIAPLAIRAETHLASPEALDERAKEYGRNAQAPATLTAYASDVANFAAWCDGRGYVSLPATPQTVARYLTEQAETGRKVATIRRRVAAIADLHNRAELENPTASKIVREILRGIAREKGVAPRQKAALTVSGLRDAVRSLEGDLCGLRDRALLLTGFHGALRRSELAALDVDDIRFERDAKRPGAVLSIRRSKTDGEGKGVEIGLPCHPDQELDPVRALEAWLEASKVAEGPLFRTFSMRRELQANRIGGRDVARILQRVAKDANLQGDLGGHSLRAGCVTALARANVSLDRIAKVSRHKSVDMLLKYVRRANILDDAPQLEIR